VIEGTRTRVLAPICVIGVLKCLKAFKTIVVRLCVIGILQRQHRSRVDNINTALFSSTYQTIARQQNRCARSKITVASGKLTRISGTETTHQLETVWPRRPEFHKAVCKARIREAMQERILEAIMIDPASARGPRVICVVFQITKVTVITSHEINVAIVRSDKSAPALPDAAAALRSRVRRFPMSNPCQIACTIAQHPTRVWSGVIAYKAAERDIYNSVGKEKRRPIAVKLRPHFRRFPRREDDDGFVGGKVVVQVKLVQFLLCRFGIKQYNKDRAGRLVDDRCARNPNVGRLSFRADIGRTVSLQWIYWYRSSGGKRKKYIKNIVQVICVKGINPVRGGGHDNKTRWSNAVNINIPDVERLRQNQSLYLLLVQFNESCELDVAGIAPCLALLLSCVSTFLRLRY